MASSSAPQTRELVSTSVALTAETASPQTGGCGVTTARSLKPKFFMARAAAPMLFGSRGRTSTILLLPIFLMVAFVSLRRRPETNENQPRRNEEHEERSEKSSCSSLLRG